MVDDELVVEFDPVTTTKENDPDSSFPLPVKLLVELDVDADVAA